MTNTAYNWLKDRDSGVIFYNGHVKIYSRLPIFQKANLQPKHTKKVKNSVKILKKFNCSHEVQYYFRFKKSVNLRNCRSGHDILFWVRVRFGEADEDR